MNALRRTLLSSIGSKFLMGLTGLGLIGFVVFHLLGNLQIYLGPEAFNRYAHFLHTNPGLVWTGRIALLILFLTHILVSIRLTAANRAARPVPYAYQNTVQASLASRTMIMTGLVILAFVIYHLMHFTFGAIDPGNFNQLDSQGRRDVYYMVVQGFRHTHIVFVYVVAQVLLGVHLSHGASSFFQSLGLNHPRFAWHTATFGWMVTLFVAGGNCFIPLSIYFGLFIPEAGTR